MEGFGGQLHKRLIGLVRYQQVMVHGRGKWFTFFVPTLIIKYAGQATCIHCLKQFCQNIISEGVVNGSTRKRDFT
jgi:hypothetical protein